MNLMNYFKDKKYLIIFYIILMTFITAVISLDERVIVHPNNIFYINFVSLVFFIIYIIAEYLYNRRFYKRMTKVIEHSRYDIIEPLPKPRTTEQKAYYDIIEKIFKDKNDQIEELSKERKENLEFVTSWVHEIKTPIAVTRLIIENESKKPTVDILNSIEEEIDKIEDHVERALYNARVDAFSKDYFITEVDMDKLIREVIKKNSRSFIGKKIKVDISEINMEVTSDKKWLFFIINQIINNSLKYTDKHGTIAIYTERDDKEKRLIIKDNGIGIKEEDIKRVFDKGFTGYTGRTSYSSTGMGLYLSKKLCDKLSHYITVDSEYKLYTKVTVHFPKLIDYFNVTKM